MKYVYLFCIAFEYLHKKLIWKQYNKCKVTINLKTKKAVNTMDKKVTMQDIADKLGITKVSVSKALNNQQGISDNLREQIIKVSKQIGYTKIKHNSEKRIYNLAWISPKRFFLEDETFYTAIYYYINRKCIDRCYSISCFVINDKEELNQQIPQQLLTDNFDGIFIAGEFKKSYLEKLDMLSIAKIAIDFYLPGIEMDSVVIDNFYTSFELTNYLINKGHKKIGFVGNINQTSSVCDRYFGYCKALKLNKLPIRDDWHIVNNDEVLGTYTTDFKLPEELPTAFVCHCDKAAFTLMQGLELRKVNLVDNISVISFDNTSICNLITPKLTSVDIDRKQIALYSMDQMIYRIEHPQSLPRKIYLGSNLVERDSVYKVL